MELCYYKYYPGGLSKRRRISTDRKEDKRFNTEKAGSKEYFWFDLYGGGRTVKCMTEKQAKAKKKATGLDYRRIV